MKTLVNSSCGTAKPPSVNSRRPRYRVLENEREALIRVYLPGVTKEAISLQLERDTLSLAAAGEESLPEEWQVMRRERDVPSFEISFTLGKGFDTGQLSAEFADGVLSIQLPRAAATLPRQISVA